MPKQPFNPHAIARRVDGKVKAYYDISSWTEDQRSTLASLADQDQHLALVIKEMEERRAEVRERIRFELEGSGVPLGAKLAVGNYEVLDTDQKAPDKVNMEMFRELYPAVYNTVVEQERTHRVLTVRKLKGEE